MGTRIQIGPRRNGRGGSHWSKPRHWAAAARHLDDLTSLDTRHDPFEILLKLADRDRILLHV
ncbi:MAG: hypothetical protein A3H97_17950 [Acidobacteria bacterium RIFCSPLOWO2_02_FULL_65_29]|nr:MAG: hypothetical protein A3H97_17950 [Acidobacteria bacterium RIFCSPLOWO2_02_FULL_65_29]